MVIKSPLIPLLKSINNAAKSYVVQDESLGSLTVDETEVKH